MVSVNERGLFHTLETERLVLKKISIQDARNLYEGIYRNFDWYKFCYQREFENFEEYFLYVLSCTQKYKDGNYYRWGIVEKESDKVIGEVLLTNNNQYNKYKLGYLISHDQRNKGYATEAVSEIVNFAFNEKNIPKIYAEIVSGNAPSLKLVRKLGMKYEDTIFDSYMIGREYHDMKIYSLINPKILVKSK